MLRGTPVVPVIQTRDKANTATDKDKVLPPVCTNFEMQFQTFLLHSVPFPLNLTSRNISGDSDVGYVISSLGRNSPIDLCFSNVNMNASYLNSYSTAYYYSIDLVKPQI